MEQESGVCNQIVTILSQTESELNKKAIILIQTLVAQIKKQSPNIQEQQLPTAIFAMLINLLKQQQEDYLPYLLMLNMMINRVNVGIFKRFILEIQGFIIRIQKLDTKYMKYCVVIITQTIQVMSKEEFMQNDKQNLEVIKTVIDILQSDNNLARKEAQKSIKMILETKYFYKQQISQVLKEFIIENLESKDVNRLIFLTQFINIILQVLPVDIIGDINYAMIKSLDTENEDFMTHIYLCIENIMANRPVTVDICESLLKEFLSNQPSFHKDIKTVQAYGQCLVQTLLHLNSLESRTAKKYITSCIAVLQEIMLVEKDNYALPNFAQNALELLIENTIDKSLWTAKSQEDQFLDDFLKIDIDFTGAQSQKSQQFQKIIIMLQHMLSSRYHNRLKQVFNVFGTLFEQIEATNECLQYIQPLLLDFIEFRSEEKVQLYFKKAMGRLVGSIGAEFLLNKFPMKLQGNSLAENFEDINNLWLLPYFQKNARKQNLSTFISEFAPLIQQIANNVNITNSNLENMSKEDRIFKSVHFLMWECFPNFINIDGNVEEQLQILDQFLKDVPNQLKENLQHFDNVLKGLQNLIINLKNHQKVQKIVTNNSQALISHLAKLIAPQKNKSKIILNVIGYLSQVAPKDYLDKVYLKNVQKLIQEQKNNKLQQNLVNSLRNFDIINQILPSVDIKDQKWDGSYQLIKLLIGEQNSYQKKTYKFLRIIIHKIHYTFLPQIIDILQNFETVLNFSRPIRIQIIKDFWEKLQMSQKTEKDIQDVAEFIQQFLPELIIGLRDSNKKCRRISSEIFEEIGNKMNELGVLNDFISMTSAGLAGDTPLMKANSITAISFLMEKFGKQLEKSFIKDLQSIIIMLIKENNKEIMKAILFFLKKYQKNMTKIDLEEEMPKIFKSIFEISDNLRMKFLPSIKQLISRLCRKFSVEKVTEALPEKHQVLAKSLVKAERREKRQKEKLKNEKKKNIYEDQKHLRMLKKMGLEHLQDEGMDMEEQPQDDKNQNLLLKYDQEKQNFHFVENQFKQIRNKNRDTLEDIEDVEIKNGKLIVTDFEALQRKHEDQETGKKRKREDKFTDLEKLIMSDKEQEAEKDAVQAPVRRTVKINKKKQFVHNIQESGETYRPSGQTGGDLIQKNKPDPYAFVQLNPKALNKRHRNKAVKSFDQVFTPVAQQNSLKGIKTKKVKQN